MELEELLDAIADDGLGATLDRLRQDHKIGKESAYQMGEAFNLYSFEVVLDGETDQIQVYKRSDNGGLVITASILNKSRQIEYDAWDNDEEDTPELEARIQEAQAPELRREKEKAVFFVSRTDEDASELISDLLKGSMGDPVKIDWDKVPAGSEIDRYNLVNLLRSSEPMSEVIERYVPEAEVISAPSGAVVSDRGR